MLLCLWLLVLAYRLITNHRVRGGLMTPFALRAASVYFFLMPVGGLLTGQYIEYGVFAVCQAMMCLAAAFTLWRVAKERRCTNESASL